MAESPITPTVGRIVLVSGTGVVTSDAKREVPAIVSRVWSQNCVNLHVFRDNCDGGPLNLTSVPYNDDVETAVALGWRWMPYQVQKAAAQ